MPFMEYCYYNWGDATSSKLHMLEKLQAQDWSLTFYFIWILGSPLQHGQFRSFLKVLLSKTFEFTKLATLPWSSETCSCYSDRLHDFSAIIPRCSGPNA